MDYSEQHQHAVDGATDYDSNPRTPAPRAAEFCIVVPTYNERGNLAELVRRVSLALGDTAWEMIVVDDDSPDGTADLGRSLHHRDPRVRVLQRLGRRGLSSACIEGMLATSAPYLAVMDGDLQHDPALLARMFAALRRNDAELVVASRYIDGGGTGDWKGGRLRLSLGATRLTKTLCKVELSDPMSGYFALQRSLLEEVARDLSGIGFKILLDIVLTARRKLRVAELPLVFGLRVYGDSKLSPKVMIDCAVLLMVKTAARLGHARRRPARTGIGAWAAPA